MDDEQELAQRNINPLQEVLNVLYAHKESMTPYVHQEAKPAAKSVEGDGGKAPAEGARFTRDSVKVTIDGVSTEHKSTRDAFRAHRLPDAKHIRFRLKLKASRSEFFDHEGKRYHFTIG